jgi:hypothetical protein
MTTQPRDDLGRWATRPTDVPSEISEPTRKPDVISDVAVPVLQSVAIGAASAIAAVIGAVVGLVPVGDVVLGAGLAAGIGFCASLWPNLMWARSSLWRTVSPIVPEPDRPVATTRIEVAELTDGGGVQRMRILDVPVDDARLQMFAKAALEGQSLAVHRWAGTMFSRSEYEQLADELTRAGLLTAPRGSRPRQLTAAGRAILRRLAG